MLQDEFDKVQRSQKYVCTQSASPFARQNIPDIVGKFVPSAWKYVGRTWEMGGKYRGQNTVLQNVFCQSDRWTESDPYMILPGVSMEHFLDGQEHSQENQR